MEKSIQPKTEVAGRRDLLPVLEIVVEKLKLDYSSSLQSYMQSFPVVSEATTNHMVYLRFSSCVQRRYVLSRNEKVAKQNSILLFFFLPKLVFTMSDLHG